MTPDIKAPSPELVAELLRRAAEAGKTTCRVRVHDPDAGVLLTLTLVGGDVVHWTVESCASAALAAVMVRLAERLDRLAAETVDGRGFEDIEADYTRAVWQPRH
jgi:hypothetical protein